MDHDIKSISQLLATKADPVAQMLLPGGKRIKNQWCCGDLTGVAGKSLQVDIAGPYAGKWRDWAGEEKGDLLDLWSHVRSVSLLEAFKQAKDYFGIIAVKPFQEKVFKPAKENPAVTKGYQIWQYLTEKRKLEGAIINRFKIGTLVMKVEGKQQGAIVFPSYNSAGELVNNSYCALERDEKGKKKIWQDQGCAPALFGWQALDERAYRERSIIIAEGQIDCMTWAQWGFDCLSIPNGGGNTWIEYEWDNLALFEKIYLSYDMDAKLSAVQESVIARLGKHRCLIIKLPRKDANDCLQDNVPLEEIKAAVEAASYPKLADFVTLNEIKEQVLHDLYSNSNQVVIQPPSLKREHADKTFTIRPGEVSIWTGIASHGKTSFITQVFLELLMMGQRAMIVSLEMKPRRIVKKMAINGCGMTDVSKENMIEFIEIIGDRVCFCDKVGSVSQDILFEMMHVASARYGVTQYLIDSLMRIEGLEEDYKAQGEFLNRLCKFASETQGHIHLVAHPRKTENDSKPSANDLKGASLLRNNADNIFVVHRNTQKERDLAEGEITAEEAEEQHDTMISVEKDREEGNIKFFPFKYQKHSERFIPLATTYKPKKQDAKSKGKRR